MSHYPRFVDIAWDTVNKLVSDWGKNPHYWELEIDIQAELRSRLALAYSILGFDEVVGVARDPAKREVTYRYSRVCCEPYVQYKDKDRELGRVMPDVVVWDDLANPRDCIEIAEGTWPILWACEIKYMDPRTTTWDVEKLGLLLDQGRIKYGCWLTFSLDPVLPKAQISWDTESHGTRLWKCSARAPQFPLP